MVSLLLYSSLLFLVLLLITLELIILHSRKFRNLPPGPPSLPIIGNLHLLQRPLHRTFQRLSQKHGDIFSLWFGSHPVVIVSSPSAFQECFTSKNDVVLANRPRTLSAKHIFYNYSTVGSCDYGEHWRNLRRITILDVLSTQRIHSFSGIRRDETNRLMHKLMVKVDSAHVVELSSMFHDLTHNSMMRMISGKRYYGDESDMKKDAVVEEAREYRKMVVELLKLLGVDNKADYLPFLRWFDFRNLEKRLGDRFDTSLNALIHENRSRNQRDNTMIDHLLKLQESQPEYYTDEIIKGLALAMLFAGTDTSAVTLEWALSNLLNHPDVLKKAREELDSTHIGQDRLLNESDLPNLPYLKNIILETLRLYPPAPLLIPHVSSDDITIGGFNIPRGTIVMVNGWAMQRDPRLWNDATCFKPERFDKEGEEKKLLAFGLGRRACPGEGLAMNSVAFTLGSLIQCFDWKRVTEEEIDMREKNWFTLSRLVPLKAVCKPRPLVNKVDLNN